LKEKRVEIQTFINFREVFWCFAIPAKIFQPLSESKQYFGNKNLGNRRQKFPAVAVSRTVARVADSEGRNSLLLWAGGVADSEGPS
jgi:hypothetical protein